MIILPTYEKELIEYIKETEIEKEDRNKLTLKKVFSNPKKVIYSRIINKTKNKKKINSNSNKIIKQLENNNDKK